MYFYHVRFFASCISVCDSVIKLWLNKYSHKVRYLKLKMVPLLGQEIHELPPFWYASEHIFWMLQIFFMKTTHTQLNENWVVASNFKYSHSGIWWVSIMLKIIKIYYNYFHHNWIQNLLTNGKQNQYCFWMLCKRAKLLHESMGYLRSYIY